MVFVCVQVKDCIGEQVQQMVPGLVVNGISNHVPSMIDEVSNIQFAVGPYLAVSHPVVCICSCLKCLCTELALSTALLHESH
jgi:hypothetical protein